MGSVETGKSEPFDPVGKKALEVQMDAFAERESRRMGARSAERFTLGSERVEGVSSLATHLSGRRIYGTLETLG